MKFTAAQLDEYRSSGFIVLRDAFPELAPLTEQFVGAYHRLAAVTTVTSPDNPARATGPQNKFKTAPIKPGSYWSELDHSLPALSIVLHREVVELGRQLLGEPDIYLRNAGVNENAPGQCVHWHRDSG